MRRPLDRGDDHRYHPPFVEPVPEFAESLSMWSELTCIRGTNGKKEDLQQLILTLRTRLNLRQDWELRSGKSVSRDQGLLDTFRRGI